MSEQRRQDPANTQMFRAFVERGSQEPAKSSRNVVIAAVAAVVVVLAVVAAVVLL